MLKLSPRLFRLLEYITYSVFFKIYIETFVKSLNVFRYMEVYL